MVNFPSGKIRKEHCSGKTESILPARELLFSSRSHSFRFFQNRKTLPVRAPRYFPEQCPLLIGMFFSKVRARSVCETFFMKGTPELVIFKKIKKSPCPLGLRDIFLEWYPLTFRFKKTKDRARLPHGIEELHA
jgi:hypothetical protein